MKKIFIGVALLAASGIGAFSFYADADPVQQNSMQTVERKANTEEKQMRESQKKADPASNAALELEAWEKLSRDEKLKLIEDKHIESRKKSDAAWAKKPVDKKLDEYEKRLKKRTLSKEERAKINQAKLADKCKGLDSGTDKDSDKDTDE